MASPINLFRSGSTPANALVYMCITIRLFRDIPNSDVSETFDNVCSYLEAYVDRTCDMIEDDDVRDDATVFLSFRIEAARGTVHGKNYSTYGGPLTNAEINDSVRLILYELHADIAELPAENLMLEKNYA